MKYHDDDLTPENVDERVEQAMHAQGEPKEASPLALMAQDLQQVYDEKRRLARVWERISGQAEVMEQTNRLLQPMKQESSQGAHKTMYDTSPMHPGSIQNGPERPFQQKPRWNWSKITVAVAVAAVLIISFVWTAAAFYRGAQTGSGGGTPVVPPTPAPTPPGAAATIPPTPSNSPVAPTPTPGPGLTVTGIDITVSPNSLSGYTCGTTITATYTATFHFPANNPGGNVVFSYTTNNGRSEAPARLTVKPGQTSASYKFSWSGALPDDHTAPGRGGVMVTSPNQITSPLIAPSGACSPAQAAFKVTSAEVVASPALTGQSCGSQFTETYTATFHIAPNSPGGTIVFNYTVNNGRSNSQNISLPVAAGQTTATYKFTWSGTLTSDHVVPGVGGVMITAPNQIISTGGVPTGQCS